MQALIHAAEYQDVNVVMLITVCPYIMLVMAGLVCNASVFVDIGTYVKVNVVSADYCKQQCCIL